jgi:hypothetical protein
MKQKDVGGRDEPGHDDVKRMDYARPFRAVRARGCADW